MSDEHQIITVAQVPPRPSSAIEMAKARLLEWAAERDSRSRAAGTTIGSMATRAGLVVMGGLIVSRLVMPGRRSASRAPGRGISHLLVGVALLTRMAMLVAPSAARVLQGTMKPRDPH